jgi:phosphoribosylanthranilate isomerase
MQLRYCTLTGIDESVSLDVLRELSDEFPFVEFGVLYSRSQAGTGRYPSLAWIEHLADNAEELGLPRLALHICGSAVDEFITQGDIVALASKFGRIQLNFRSSKYEPKAIASAIKRVAPECRVITQVNDANAKLAELLRWENCYNHELLFDKSGGRGVSPQEWPVIDHFTGNRCGYAGGLGPDNLATELPRIAQAANDWPVWVDMEGKLRDESDRFDGERARTCLELVRAYLIADAQKRLGADKTGMQPVEELSGLWLDWWVGHLCGYNMVMPTIDACKATYLHRRDGKFHSLEFGDYWAECGRELASKRVGVLPNQQDSGWSGVYFPEGISGYETVSGRTSQEAVLRALVCQFAGRSVPVNPLEYTGKFAVDHVLASEDDEDESDE